MQTLVEQQRLQLLQTENQLRVRGIEDMELMVTTQATFPGDGGAGFAAGQGGGGNPYEAFGFTLPAAGGVMGPQDYADPYSKTVAASQHPPPGESA